MSKSLQSNNSCKVGMYHRRRDACSQDLPAAGLLSRKEPPASTHLLIDQVTAASDLVWAVFEVCLTSLLALHSTAVPAAQGGIQNSVLSRKDLCCVSLYRHVMKLHVCWVMKIGYGEIREPTLVPSRSFAYCHCPFSPWKHPRPLCVVAGRTGSCMRMCVPSGL